MFNMFSYEFNLSNRKKLQIFPLSDVHIGNPQFNQKFLEYWIKNFRGSKSEKIIYLQGDLIDLAVKRLGNSAYEQTMSVDDQIETILSYLKPLKHYIVGSVPGNHELRTRKEFDLDVSKLIASELDCEYAPSLYHKLLINDKEYKVFAQHGNKTSNQLHLMLGQVIRQTQHIDANLFLYGHCHYCESLSLPDVNFDGYNRRNIVLTGHFLDFRGSYAEFMGLKPNPPAFPVISVGVGDNDKIRSDVRIINSDEVI